jgi:hypothetical protein
MQQTFTIKRIARNFSLFVFIVALVAPTFVSAYSITKVEIENRNDFVVGPGKIEIFANPGETIRKTISVINRTNRRATYSVVTEDFMGSDRKDAPVVLLGEEESPYSFKSNLIPEVKQFSLNFSEKIDLPITIKIPEDAQPGGFYSSVIIASQPAAGSIEQTGARAISRVGVLFFVRVNGDVKEEGRVSDFRVTGERKLFIQGSPYNFEIQYNNTGTVHLVPFGNIEISNIFGKKIGEVKVDPYFSMPGSLRYREVVWDKDGLFGRYTAQLTINRGYGGNVDVVKIAFWVVPWNMIGIAVLIALAAYLLFYIFTRKFELRRRE